jgi:hypothetical protein
MSMKTILLSKGLLMVVDEIDYDYLSQWLWTAYVSENTTYAARNCNGTPLYAHVVVAQRAGHHKVGMDVDHIDGCGLNNQRENLRAATRQQNNLNQHRLARTNKSGHRGVCWDKSRNKWKAYIRVNGKMWSRRFDTKQEAIDARQKRYAEVWQAVAT